jgi:hypothetical protein
MNEYDFHYRHLQSAVLKDKDAFLRATLDIEHSFTGRIDILISGLNRFFLESSKMVRNAIKLYEEGLFDAAFYSARTAVELARVVAFFSNEDEVKDSEIYAQWRKGGKFPFDATIKRELEKSSGVYAEIHAALNGFFSCQRELLSKVQKYIHKQGYRTFHDRGFVNPEIEKRLRDTIASDFYLFIKGALAEIAFLRLCVDPFPILLRDDRVRYRIHSESMTEPFSDDYVDRIIGEDRVRQFCSTEYYLSHVKHFENNEQMSEEMYVFVNNQYYNRNDWKLIESQMHLLSKNDVTVVKIFNISNKISKIYMAMGIQFYFSDVHSVRTNMGFSSKSLQEVKDLQNRVNSKYDEAYLSCFPYDGDYLWVEHNEPLTGNEDFDIKKVIGG